jgi:hypothetical protein
MYWLGNVYHNCGNYSKCYEIWGNYLANYEKTIDFTPKKAEKIKKFMKTYELLGNSLNQFKENLNYVQKEDFKRYSTNRKEETDEETAKQEVKDFLSDFALIRDLVPNIKENFSVTYEFYHGLINFYVKKDFDNALRILCNLINAKPLFIEVYFALWKLIKLKEENRILLNFSYYMIRQSHNPEINYDDWIKSYILYSKALFINNRVEDALELLRNLLDIFANIPLEEIKFLSEVNKSNRISTTNNFVNFDYALSFYSKYHVYQKSEAIFHYNYKSKTGGKEKFELGGVKLFDMELDNNNNNNNILNKNLIKQKIIKSLSIRSVNFAKQSDNEEMGNTLYLNESSMLLNNTIYLNQLRLNTNEENCDKFNEMQNEILKKNVRNLNEAEDVIEDIEISNLEEMENYIEKKIDKVQITEEYICILI